MKEKKAAIWVSTVLYILITIAVLGIAFAALKPEIDRMRDKAVIEQSLEMLNNIDETINQVSEVQGTRLKATIQLKKGSLIFDCRDEENKIIWKFNTNYKYSEPGEEIEIGNIKVKTSKLASFYEVSLFLKYDNIKFEENNVRREFTEAELPYVFFFENKQDFIDITQG